jgi:hypothetical protein
MSDETLEVAPAELTLPSEPTRDVDNHAIEREIGFLERLLREPALLEQFKKNPQRTALANDVVVSQRGEQAIMRGLAEALAYANPDPLVREPMSDALQLPAYFPRHPYAAPGDTDFGRGPTAVYVAVAAVAAAVTAAATIVAAAAAVYSAVNSSGGHHNN